MKNIFEYICPPIDIETINIDELNSDNLNNDMSNNSISEKQNTMKTLNQYINEKLVLKKDTHNYDFKIDIDAASDAKALLKGIEEVYGKTGIHAEDGKYQNVIFSGETLDDFLKVCGLISVAWNMEGTDSMMDYNGNAQDENDLAFYVPDCPEIKENIDTIEKYANLWIKWFENNEFEYR
jgi:hypothetical protein